MVVKLHRIVQSHQKSEYSDWKNLMKTPNLVNISFFMFINQLLYQCPNKKIPKMMSILMMYRLVRTVQ